MFQNFIVVFLQVMTLFAMMAVGFALEKLKMISRAGTGEMSAVLLYVVNPCIVINAFQMDKDPQTIQILGIGCASLTACYLAYVALCYLFFRKEPISTQAPLRYGCIYGNVAFIGLPLVRAVIGEEGVFFAVLITIVGGIFCWTHGVLLMGGKEHVSLKQALINPGTVSMAAALLFYFLQIRLSGPVYTAMGFICELNTPLAMIVIGAQLARSDLLSALRGRTLYVASVVKLLIVPAITAVILWPFRENQVFYLSMIILAGAPAGGYTSMFAQMFGRDEQTGAQLISLSTLLSAVTLPMVVVAANLLLEIA